ncbi:soj family protein [Pseudoroseomonas ludipueritiae]|uniref:Soj family protein n=1 Tax=Pseudoroseomonas ludipueritiae TaxID=198093 RepID=A0ABR7RAC5_9PROT|nr:soj family protein [Pseudoroseomonas ludipueritiae]MBC9178774.1 soj family protein [Pseudoroseomonas ludipueritiae]MCG7363343.1 soj family protein [Roseomonas sp. ACRSG]
MDTPIAAVLWTEQARRDLSSVLRLLGHAERCCQDLGSEEAAALVAQAMALLARDGAARKMAA